MPPRRRAPTDGLGSLVSGADLTLDFSGYLGRSRYLLVVAPHSLWDRRKEHTTHPRHRLFSYCPPCVRIPRGSQCGAGAGRGGMRCGQRALDPNLFDEAAGSVVTRRLGFDTLWVYGGADDTVMLNADRLAAFPGGDAAVLDLLGRRVHRVGVGGVAWSWGTRGEGPGETDHVRDLDVNAEGEVVLADAGNGKLHWLSGDGTWLREAGLPEGPINVDAVAALEGGHYILSSLMYAAAL